MLSHGALSLSEDYSSDGFIAEQTVEVLEMVRDGGSGSSEVCMPEGCILS